MRALGTDPMKKLVTPRVVSTVFMLFFLTIISDLVGLVGGLAIAKLLLKLDARQYWYNAWQTLVFQDVFMGLIKPVIFGFIIATIGCFYGMNARGGTQGVSDPQQRDLRRHPRQRHLPGAGMRRRMKRRGTMSGGTFGCGATRSAGILSGRRMSR